MQSITLEQVKEIVNQIKVQAGKKKAESQQISVLMDGVGIGLDTLVQELANKLEQIKDEPKSNKSGKSKTKKD